MFEQGSVRRAGDLWAEDCSLCKGPSRKVPGVLENVRRPLRHSRVSKWRGGGGSEGKERPGQVLQGLVVNVETWPPVRGREATEEAMPGLR